MSTINITEASSVAAIPDDAAYLSSTRCKKLFNAIDKTLTVTEKQFQHKLRRVLVKPLRCHLKKSDLSLVSQTADELVEEWRATAQEAMTEVITDNEITRQLYNLDEIVAREKKRNPQKEPAWRPTGHPSFDTEPSAVLRALEARDRLKKMVENLERDAVEEKRFVEQGRERMLALDKEISDLGKEIKKELKFSKAKEDENGQIQLTKEDLVELKGELQEYLKNE